MAASETPVEMLLGRYTWTKTGDPLTLAEARQEFGSHVMAYPRAGWFWIGATPISAAAIRATGHRAVGSLTTTWIPPQTGVNVIDVKEPEGNHRSIRTSETPTPDEEYVMPAAVPKPFLEEFTEVFEDLELDLSKSIFDLDEEVGRRCKAYVLQLVKIADGDNNRVLDNLMSGMLWMFLAGREHAARGFPSPVPKDDPSVKWVPDTIAGLLRDDE